MTKKLMLVVKIVNLVYFYSTYKAILRRMYANTIFLLPYQYNAQNIYHKRYTFALFYIVKSITTDGIIKNNPHIVIIMSII